MILEFCGKRGIDLIQANRSFIFADLDGYDFELVLCYLRPSDFRLYDLILMRLAKLSCSAFIISSSSVNSLEIRYKYVQEKCATEFLAHMYGVGILRAGSKSFKTKCISEFQYLDDKQTFFAFLDRAMSGTAKAVEVIYKAHESQRGFFSTVFGKVYYACDRLVLGNRILLRPLDLILKCFGVDGYGYSFITKDDIKK